MIPSQRVVSGALFGLLTALGTAGALWVWPGVFTPDGLSYLERAEAFLRGEGFPSPYWSPLYPALLAVVLVIAEPSPANEVFWVHAVSAVMFALASGGLLYLLQVREKIAQASSPRSHLARSLFVAAVWVEVALRWNILPWPSPDLLVAGLVFWTAAVALDADRDPSRTGPFAALGLLLGLGYMAKTAMAPLGAALLGILWLFRRRAWGRQVRRLYLAAGLFLAVFFGYSAWLSADQERLTFGDSGRLNYAWEVVWDPEIKWFGWSGEVEGSGTPAHGPRVLGDGPRLLDYSGAFPDATAPMWFEPSYWNAGLKAPFRLERQLEALYSETAKLAAFLWDQRFTVAAGFICVLLAWRSAAARLPLRWLAIWAVVPLAMYCTVFMAYRYVYPFWILLWIALALPEPLEPRKAKAHTLLLLVSAALLFAETGRRVLYDIRHPTNVDRGAVAEHLAESGIPPHARLAQIGLAGDVSYLRRIPARVTHLIPVRDLQSFEEASADRLRRLLETLQGEDVDALFAGERPAGLLLNAWRPGPSNYVFVLPVEDALAALPEADQMRGDQSP